MIAPGKLAPISAPQLTSSPRPSPAMTAGCARRQGFDSLALIRRHRRRFLRRQRTAGDAPLGYDSYPSDVTGLMLQPSPTAQEVDSEPPR